jgi:ABC-type ATPase involved in cell division
MKLVELFDYSLAPFGEGKGIRECRFDLSLGEVCFIRAVLPDDAKLFLRALATLEKPLSGSYRFRGEALDFSDYRHLLPFKRKIAYVASDAALISNRSLLDNLRFVRAFFDNEMDSELPDDLMELFRQFQMEEKLHLRPGQVELEFVRLTIILRELSKKPEMLLLERPRDFLSPRNFDLFVGMLKDMIKDGVPVVCLASDEAFIGEFAGKEVRITEGSVETAAS